MSILSGIPQVAALVSQPAVLAAGLAAGVAVGAVGVGTGAIPVVDPAPRNVSLFECPGSGRIVTSIRPNQNVLVTARSADGQWLQIYVGEAAVDRGWAPATVLDLTAAPDALPVEDCTPQSTDAPLPTTLEPPSQLPSIEPSPDPSASLAPSGVPATVGPSVAATPTPAATTVATPTPTPGPTPPGPYFSDLTIYDPPRDPSTGNYIFYPPGCPAELFTHAGMTVVITDPDGVGAVFLYYQPSGAASWSSVEMLDEGNDIYDAQIYSDGSWGDGVISYYIKAYDSTEAHATLYGDSEHVLELKYCAD